MTILLSEISQFGVVMVADSAITSTHVGEGQMPSGTPIPQYVRRGAEKIVVVPNRPIAFSFWGMGRIGSVPTDLWLADFFSTKLFATVRLEEICQAVADEVNDAFFKGRQDEEGGFHVGALELVDSVPTPVLYHIHRGHDRANLGKFELHKDRPGDMPTVEYCTNLSNGTTYILRNGAIAPLAVLQGPLVSVSEQLASEFGIVIPHPPTVEARERWLRLQVGVLCDLFAISSRVSIVARPLSSVTISMDGTVRHSSAVRDLGFI